MSRADVPGLVAEARAAHDPHDELASASERAWASIDWETPVFADGEEDDSWDGEAIPLSGNQELCLDEHGISEDGSTIPDEIFDRCVGAAWQ